MYCFQIQPLKLGRYCLTKTRYCPTKATRTVVLKQGIVLIPILVHIKHTFQTASVICGTRAYDGIHVGITIVQ